jgi:general L-amino acid transport system permease protein
MSGRDAVAGMRLPGTGGAVPDDAGGPLRRATAWLRGNLFNGALNSALTVIVVVMLVVIVPPFLRWAVSDAALSGVSRAACTGDGACWTFIRLRLPTFIYGHYPPDERWRVHAVLLLLVAFGFPALRGNARRRGLLLGLLLTAFPLLAGVLLLGGVPGLPFVDTSLWGGLMLDVVISFVTVAGSLPLGILLALGRRSQLRVVRTLCVGFIEIWRGVPLLTVLFMSAVMVPLFLPEGVSVDRLLRAMVALVLFNSAYMAEVIRGALQGVPGGQEEAGYSLGLHWAQVQTPRLFNAMRWPAGRTGCRVRRVLLGSGPG